jgi:hypothetical protein
MAWRIHTRVFGPHAEPRWFVVQDTVEGTTYMNNKRGRPLPFDNEQAAEKAAAELNAGVPSVSAEEWLDISTRC